MARPLSPLGALAISSALSAKQVTGEPSDITGDRLTSAFRSKTGECGLKKANKLPGLGIRSHLDQQVGLDQRGVQQGGIRDADKSPFLNSRPDRVLPTQCDTDPLRARTHHLERTRSLAEARC